MTEKTINLTIQNFFKFFKTKRRQFEKDHCRVRIEWKQMCSATISVQKLELLTTQLRLLDIQIPQ